MTERLTIQVLEQFRDTLNQNALYKVDNPQYEFAFARDMSMKDLAKLKILNKNQLTELARPVTNFTYLTE